MHVFEPLVDAPQMEVVLTWHRAQLFAVAVLSEANVTFVGAPGANCMRSRPDQSSGGVACARVGRTARRRPWEMGWLGRGKTKNGTNQQAGQEEHRAPTSCEGTGPVRLSFIETCRESVHLGRAGWRGSGVAVLRGGDMRLWKQDQAVPKMKHNATATTSRLRFEAASMLYAAPLCPTGLGGALRLGAVTAEQ